MRGQAGSAHQELGDAQSQNPESCRALHCVTLSGGREVESKKTPIPKTANRAREKEKTPPKKRGLKVLLCSHTFMCLIL